MKKVFLWFFPLCQGRLGSLCFTDVFLLIGLTGMKRCECRELVGGAVAN